MIASAQTLRRLRPIAPFHDRTVVNGMTYGLGPAGYDIRIAQDVTLWPGSFQLASAIEHFTIPFNMMGEIADKSSLIRRGLSVFNSKAEPGWHGYLTLELKNNQPIWKPWKVIRLKAGDPIAHFIFHILDEPTDQPYSGRYQAQAAGPQVARFAKQGERA